MFIDVANYKYNWFKKKLDSEFKKKVYGQFTYDSDHI